MAKRKKTKQATKSVTTSSFPENQTLDGVSAEDLALVTDWLNRTEEWEAKAARLPYDGILGTLPEWIPRGINSEFVRIRNNLLSDTIAGTRVTHALALEWINRYALIGETDEDGYIPTEVFEVVGLLTRWRYIVSLGSEKGLQELGVPSAAFLGRKHGGFARETLYLVQLRKKYPHEPADDLYRTLRQIAQTPSSARNPTPETCPFNAEHVGGKLEVLKRGKLYSLGAFRNAISDLDKRIARGEFSDI
jgi:hypothetical protein